MQKISSCIWFHNRGEEAANFYVSLFENAKLGDIHYYDKASAEASGQPEGLAITVAFELEGQNFLALNGGPQYKITPAISFFVYCDDGEEVDALFATLSEGGTIFMPLQRYPFSDRYGWVQDKYGLSWQVYLGKSSGQKIVPMLTFADERSGRAEEAMKFYTTVFENSEIGEITRYGSDEAPDCENTVKHASFRLNGQEFMCMDSNKGHGFDFSEAVSFIVDCNDQTEVDYYWGKFTEEGEEGPCAWLKDTYGVAWQVVPRVLNELLHDENKEKAGRVMGAMLQMKKIDIQTLKDAYNQPV